MFLVVLEQCGTLTFLELSGLNLTKKLAYGRRIAQTFIKHILIISLSNVLTQVAHHQSTLSDLNIIHSNEISFS